MSIADSTTEVQYGPIEGFPNYRVGDDGSVWSRKVMGSRGVLGKWKQLAKFKDQCGYWYVCIGNTDGTRATRYVHSLVLTAFVGPRPADMVCAHGDGDPGNNRVSNLRWATKVENAADRRRHGRTKVPKPIKLTEGQVAVAIELIKSGRTYADIGRQFGVSYQTIKMIGNGTTWRHLTGGAIRKALTTR
jgi:hypothetical protein